MFHVLAWAQTIDPAGVLTAINAVREPEHVTDGIYQQVHPALPLLCGVAGLINDASGARARLDTPSLSEVGGQDIEPVSLALSFGAPPETIMFPLSPRALVPHEQMRFMVQSTPGVARRHVGLAFVTDEMLVPIAGEIRSVRASATIQQVDFLWSEGVITFEQTLPTGRYIVVGMRCRSTNGIAARLIFRGKVGRPGGPILTAVNEMDDWRFRHGNLGVWGVFDSTDPPILEIFHGSVAVQNLILDLMRF